MGQALQPMALVVEDDETQREMICLLLEESDMSVVQCESAEEALLVLDKIGGFLAMIFTNLAGVVKGHEFAAIARKRFPHVTVIVTSGRDPPHLPDGALFMPKPWRPLDLLREAERCLMH